MEIKRSRYHMNEMETSWCILTKSIQKRQVQCSAWIPGPSSRPFFKLMETLSTRKIAQFFFSEMSIGFFFWDNHFKPTELNAWKQVQLFFWRGSLITHPFEFSILFFILVCWLFYFVRRKWSVGQLVRKFKTIKNLITNTPSLKLDNKNTSQRFFLAQD